MFFVSCVSHALASVHYCLAVTCWERADLLAPVGDVYCIFVTFLVHCCLAVTCWERADLLALVADVYCISFLLLSHVISWVRCGSRLYRFLILAVFLILMYSPLFVGVLYVSLFFTHYFESILVLQ